MITNTFSYQLDNKMESSRYSFQSVIDLGNSTVKASSRFVLNNGQDSKSKPWTNTIFSSHVATPSNPFISYTKINDKKYIVGDYSKGHSGFTRVCDSSEGKTDNAIPLVLTALLSTLKTKGDIFVDLVFTSPSIKSYGNKISKILTNSFYVEEYPDGYSNAPSSIHHVQINKAIPKLEGYRAISNIDPTELSNYKVGVLIDIGCRTIIVTEFLIDSNLINPTIVSRRVFDNQGVESICSYISTEELLCNQPKLKAMANSEDINNYLFTTPITFNKKNKRVAVQTSLETQSYEFVNYIKPLINDSTKKIYVCGGGANLPGIDKYLNASLMDNPRWSNITAIRNSFEEIINEA